MNGKHAEAILNRKGKEQPSGSIYGSEVKTS